MAKSPLEIMTEYYDLLINERPGAREFVFGVWADHCILTFPRHPCVLRHLPREELAGRCLQDRPQGEGRGRPQHRVLRTRRRQSLRGVALPPGLRTPLGREKLEAERFCIYGFENERVISMRVLDVNADVIAALRRTARGAPGPSAVPLRGGLRHESAPLRRRGRPSGARRAAVRRDRIQPAR